MLKIMSNTTLDPLKSFNRSIKLNLMRSSSLKESKRKKILYRKSIKTLILLKLSIQAKKAKINLKMRMVRATQIVQVIKSLAVMTNLLKLGTMLRKTHLSRQELT